MLKNKSFNFLQWNTLGKNFSDAKGFPKVKEEYLAWDYRKEHLKSIIDKLNPDLMTFQEIDSFPEFKDYIVNNDYGSVYYAKDEGGQGIAFFYRNEHFELIKSERIVLPKDDQETASNQFFCYSIIKEKDSGRYLCIISTHLKAKAEFEPVRLVQVRFMLKYLEGLEKELKVNYGTCGIIVAGDFNAEPSYSCIKEIESFNSFPLKSVYDYNNEIEMTTFKLRDKENYRVIDYVFYTEPIAITSKVLPPTKKDLTEILETGFPSADFPSDHYYLFFTFE
jgi:mRNA deadenylase 3'-5' endonuclease subunit Ccr4